MSKILIVEDEKAIRNVLVKIIRSEDKKYKVSEAVNGKEALKKVEKENFDLVLCDIKMPFMDGVEFLEQSKELSPETAVVMISGHGDIETAVHCIKKGAYDFISKPPDMNHLLKTVRNALDKKHLLQENLRLRKKMSESYTIIGESEPIDKVRELIDKVSVTDARVLITGANGTGKELIAHQIHEKSLRSSMPFIEVNCAAIPSELIESELFGHEKGSFTSAIRQKKGKFEVANGGTLFLDEIGDMSLSAQAKVLRVLQDSIITRVGGEKTITVDVRVIAATNKNLQKEIAEGRFREDLYHRIGVILIKNPSLDERKEDIPLLVHHFISLLCLDQGISPRSITSEALMLLQEYAWPGNIRELRNVIERLIILGSAEITADDIRKYASK